MASRDDLLSAIQAQLQQAGVEATKKDCGVALDAVLKSVREVALAEGSIRTVIGTFKRRDLAARTARNPRTGESVDVAAKTTLALKASSIEEEQEEAPAPKTAAKKPAAAPAKKAPAAPVKKVVAKKK